MATEPTWPDDLAPEAYHGVIGRIVNAVALETEADVAGVHLAMIVAAGNVVGRGPYFPIGADRHNTVIYATLVGKTSGGKGQATGLALEIVSAADSEWAKLRQVEGLSTGEGLIFYVRDAREEQRVASEEEAHLADENGMLTEMVDAGVADKRALVVESEFAQPLTAASRAGNTLSAVIRSMYDKGNAGSLTKASPIRTTGAHVSMIANITDEELKKKLSATEMANGLGNRFAWCCVKRSRSLPLGGNLGDDVLDPLKKDLTDAVREASRIGEMGMSRTAQGIWSTAYNEELTRDREGLFGAICGRAHSISLRMAVLFAALDGSHVIEAPHVEAALATWRRCEQSAAYLFGGSTGDHLTDRTLAIITEAGTKGIKRSEIREKLGSHAFTAERITDALETLRDQGSVQVTVERDGGRGRNPELWTLIPVEYPPIPPIDSADGATA